MGYKYKPRHGFTPDEMEILELRWCMMKRSKLPVSFESFDQFVRYAQGKFAYGLAMERIDENKGWCPENIHWFNPQKQDITMENLRKYAIRWEKMMQPLRKKYAKELAGVKAQQEREFFRYEHPDLVREGIVFDPSR